MKRSLDLVIASLMFLCGLIITVKATATISKIEAPAITILKGYLPLGKSGYYVINDKNDCVGKIKIKVNKQKAYLINVLAELNLAINRNSDVESLNISGYFYFNPLGQLSDSNVVVKLSDRELASAKTRGVKPIKWKVTLNNSDRHSIQGELDGPITINEHDNSEMWIEAHTSLPTAQTKIALPLLSALTGIRVKKEDDYKQRACNGTLELEAIRQIMTLRSFI